MRHTCTKVTLRQRLYDSGRISLYWDYYPAIRNPETMQMTRRENLGVNLYAHPKNEIERSFNNGMQNKAEANRCIRVQTLINEEFGVLDRTKTKTDFLAYFLKMCRKKDQKWRIVYQLFYNYVQGHCTFGDVTIELCQGFREYLLNANQTLESYALRYRIIRMEQGYNSPIIAHLDSLFSSEDSSDSIHQLRHQVSNYELAIERQAELHLQQQRLSQEKEALTQQLQR